MRAFIQRHPVATYYVLVFAISWGGGVIVLGPAGASRSRDDRHGFRFPRCLRKATTFD